MNIKENEILKNLNFQKSSEDKNSEFFEFELAEGVSLKVSQEALKIENIKKLDPDLRAYLFILRGIFMGD